MRKILTLLCAIVIVFDIPEFTLAEQHTADPMNLSAKMAGEQDASNDISMFSQSTWLARGICVGCSLTIIGTIAANSIANKAYPKNLEYKDYKRVTRTQTITSSSEPKRLRTYTEFVPKERYQRQIGRSNRLKFIGTFASPAISVLLSHWTGLTIRPSTPPSVRLLGKSPEYIKAYSQAYIAKNRSIKRRAFFAGSVVGIVSAVSLAQESCVLSVVWR